MIGCPSLPRHDGRSRRRARSQAGATLAAVAAFLVPWSAEATAGLMFLRESPLSRFTEEDFTLLRRAAGTVLDSGSRDASEEWANPGTGNSGRVTVTSRFTAADGRPCARLRMDARSAAFDGSWTYTVCRVADGDWKIDPAAKPQDAAAKAEQ
jgi:surface antigen